MFKEGQDQFHEGQDHFYEGQDHFYGMAGPYLWKGRMGGRNSDLAIEKWLIPGMLIVLCLDFIFH